MHLLEKKLKGKKWISCLFLCLWVGLVLFCLLLKKAPLHDEAHAWVIAAFSPLWQLFILTRWEGHFFLWYILVRLVAKLGYYPYSLYALNFLCCFLGIFLIWRKAPFSTILKLIVLFSFSLFLMYPTYARPYSLAFLCLTGLAVCYPTRLKHPFWYAILLFLCAHTHLLGTIGAVAFGLFFAFDLIQAYYQRKIPSKYFWGAISICFFTAVCLLAETVGFQRPSYALPGTIWQQIKVCSPFFITEILICLVSLLFLMKSPRALFFGLFTIGGALSIHFFIYSFWFWQEPFLFVYLVFAFWLFRYECPSQRPQILFFLFLATGSFLYYFSPVANWPISHIGFSKEIVEKEYPLLQQAKIFTVDATGLDLGPYLYPQGIHTYNLETGLEDLSFENLKLLYSRGRAIRYGIVAPLLDEDKPNLLIIYPFLFEHVLRQISEQPYRLQFTEYACDYNRQGYCIFIMGKDPREKSKNKTAY